MDINEITHEILDSAYKVHTALGPGLLESAYKTCLAYELRKKGLIVEEETTAVHFFVDAGTVFRYLRRLAAG